MVKVVPLPKNRWKLTIEDLVSKTISEKEYDVVLVCVGNYSVPNIPKVAGIDAFKGSVIHSHDYRKPDPYNQKKVLIVGSGPSGVDILRLLDDISDEVIEMNILLLHEC